MHALSGDYQECFTKKTFEQCLHYAPPLIGEGIKRCFCLTSVCLTSDICLTSVAYIVNIYGAHSYWKQGALGAAGQACMGWSWTAACVAYRGGGISWRPPAYGLFFFSLRILNNFKIYCILYVTIGRQAPQDRNLKPPISSPDLDL